MNDFQDLIWKEPPRTPDWQIPIGELHKQHDFMRHVVIHCITFGSEAGVRSTLLPTCRSFGAALCWNRRAAASHRKNCGFMVRINTQMVGEDNIIDVSSKEAQQAFFIKGLYNYGGFVSTNNWALRRSIDNKEVLIMYRGKVSLLAMDVVNPDDGEFVMPLLEALARASLRVGSAVVRTILRPYLPDGRKEIEACLQRCATGVEPMARSLAGIPPRPTREYDPSTAVSTKKELEQECAQQGNTKKLRIKSPPDSKDTPAVAQSHGSLAGGSQSSTRRSPPPPPARPP